MFNQYTWGGPHAGFHCAGIAEEGDEKSEIASFVSGY